MKIVKFEDMVNTEKKNRNLMIQLLVLANTPRHERVCTKSRDPIELKLLYMAIKDTEKRYIESGRLFKTGRRWQLKLQLTFWILLDIHIF